MTLSLLKTLKTLQRTFFGPETTGCLNTYGKRSIHCNILNSQRLSVKKSIFYLYFKWSTSLTITSGYRYTKGKEGPVSIWYKSRREHPTTEVTTEDRDLTPTFISRGEGLNRVLLEGTREKKSTDWPLLRSLDTLTYWFCLLRT